MNRPFDFSTGEFYHIYSRGIEHRNIFLDDRDYLRFTTLLYVANSATPIHISNFSKWKSFDFFQLPRGARLVDITAYCLMTNHFHLLIHDPNGGNISIFMKKLLTGYSMYFNKKYHRTGSLFEGAFKAQHVNADEYLKYLFAYIHLNPIKIIEPSWKETGIINKRKAEQYLATYPHSSYLDYCGEARSEQKIINREASPEYFTTSLDFKDFVRDWLEFKDAAI